MSEETQQEEVQQQKTERGRVPNWMTNLLVGAISVVFGKYVLQGDSEKKDLRKEKAELQVKLDSCLNHRFDEMTHRYDEKSNELQTLKNRIDSLRKN